MRSYFRAFLEALSSGAVERRTDTRTGDEAIYRNGKMIACSGTEPLAPDLVETVKAAPHIIMFGAGHIGKALYGIGRILSLRMTVLDDRPEMLTEEGFPSAERHVAPFESLLSREYDAVSPAYVIFTHGHAFDTGCLRYALRHESSYIGMIGSRAKAEGALNQLRSEGFSEEQLAAVHTPIGLQIGAETPEEIALSIMAELIASYRSEKGIVTIDPMLLREMITANGIAARIISKHGSAPRSRGAMMLIRPDSAVSTIGGGALEEAVMEEARKMLRDGQETKTVHYSLREGGEIGMVCGGETDVLLRRL